MILHTVMFRWKDGVTAERVAAVTMAVHALRGAIPGLLSIQGGPDIGLRSGNPDYLLLATFADEAAWHAYQAHPRHKALLSEVIDPILFQRQSMQIVS